VPAERRWFRLNAETDDNEFMEGRTLALALTSGALAAFNPCGFAMLPAYLASFVSSDQADRPTASRVLRAVRVGSLVTGGFLAVFGVIGFVFQELGSFLRTALPIVTGVIGLGLVILGIAMWFGYEPKFAVPRVQTDTSAKDSRAMFLYGVSYATVSLGCTLPLFLVHVVRNLQREGVVSGVVSYGAYALGMGLVVVTLTIAVALAQQGFVRGMRKVLPYVNRASAVLLILAGGYVAYYGWFEWQQERSGIVTSGGGLADWMFRRSGDLQTFLQERSELLLLVGVALAGVTAAAFVLRPRPDSKTDNPTPEQPRPTGTHTTTATHTNTGATP
jgi:cytochrome c-type biogenesis protein